MMLKTLALLSLLHTTPAADTIPGTWQISGDVAGNPLEMVCTIRQNGTALSGSCGNEAEQPILLTGTVKEEAFTFEQISEYDGQPITIVYTGTIASPAELKGTVTVLPFDANGVFTATRVPPKS